MSIERLRQLLRPLPSRCDVHGKDIPSGYCYDCRVTKRFARILGVAKAEYVKTGNVPLLVDYHINRLKRHIRTKPLVIQRSMLIRFLKDDLNWDLELIQNSLNRDRDSINNLYNKNYA